MQITFAKDTTTDTLAGVCRRLAEFTVRVHPLKAGAEPVDGRIQDADDESLLLKGRIGDGSGRVAHIKWEHIETVEIL